MRSLRTRVDALETSFTPFVPVRIHLIGQRAGMSEEQALAAYGAENGPVGEEDGFIYLVGVEVGGN